MNLMTSLAVRSTLTSMRRTAIAGLALVVAAPLAWAQPVVDPDPEIFDGTKTKSAAASPSAETTVDDWESGSMIVYDTNGENAQQGQGQGGGGTDAEGTEISVNVGIPMGLPMGMPGGGAETPAGMPPLQIPMGQPPGAPPSASTDGMSGAMPNGDTSGAAQSAARPSDVSIGDPSQRIKTNAQGKAGNVAGAPEGGEPGGKEAGEDTTEMPNSIGSGSGQSGTRGGGVEKGDAMPPDEI